MGYTPGQPVEATGITAAKRRRKAPQRLGLPLSELPSDILSKILINLVNDRRGLSVMLMSMVNHDLRWMVQMDLKVWHMLYQHWRGHLSTMGAGQEAQAPLTRMIRSPQGAILRLNPSVPRTLPNFQHKPPSLGCAPSFPRCVGERARHDSPACWQDAAAG